MDSRLIFLMVCIGIAVLLIFSLVWLIHEEVIYRKLLKEGVRTKGKITSKRIETYHRYGRCLVTFRFRAQSKHNKLYTVEQPVVGARYELLSIGTEVDVIYLPSDPQSAQLEFE